MVISLHIYWKNNGITGITDIVLFGISLGIGHL